MCINVACSADVTVTQPLLDFLQAHAIGIEQTGAAMAQIVKADTLHLVCDQKIREMLAQEIGPNPFSHRVYIDIVKIIGAIAFAADLPILLLLLFHFIEHLLTGRNQGKCPAARLCFCLIVLHDSNHRPSGRAVKRRDDGKNLSGFRNYIKRLLRFLIPVNIRLTVTVLS